MTDRRLDVHMDGVKIGNLHMSGAGNLTFEYDTEYTQRENATPLSLSMPVSKTRHKNKVVRSFLQGLLPDNAQALSAMATRYRVSANSPFALLEHVGHDVAGALQIVQPGETVEDSLSTSTPPSPISDSELAQALHEVIDTYRSGTPAPETQRMSIAGAQPKLALVKTESSDWAVPDRTQPTTYILKPLPRDGAAFPKSDLVELLCLRALARAGIPAADTDIWEAPDQSVRAIVSRRYDRYQGSDGTVHRRHQEDLCQAIGIDPAHKYQSDGGPGLGDIAQLFRAQLTADDSLQASRDFLRGVVAHTFLFNTDAHAKNYSLLFDGDTVRLAPMYDVVSYAPYIHADDDRKILSSLRLGGTYDLRQILPEALVEAGRTLGVPRDESERIVEDTVTNLAAALEAEAGELQALDDTGILGRTVEAVQENSPLYASVRETFRLRPQARS